MTGQSNQSPVKLQHKQAAAEEEAARLEAERVASAEKEAEEEAARLEACAHWRDQTPRPTRAGLLCQASGSAGASSSGMRSQPHARPGPNASDHSARQRCR